MTDRIDADFPEQDQLQALVANALEYAQKQGASAAEAGMSYGAGLNVSVRMGDVETLEYNRDRSLAITVFVGHKKGSASTSDWSEKAIQESVNAACAIAKHSGEDPYSGLAEAGLMAKELPDLELSHPWDLGAEQGIELAKECEDAARSHAGITNSEGASVATRSGLSVYGNTHGFLGGYAGTRHSISCSVIAADDTGMQRDYWYTIARDWHALEQASAVGHRAAERALQRRNAKKIKTAQVPVIFNAEVATGFFRHLISAISGSALYRQSSFLLDHLGKQIFPDSIQIIERPHLKKALGSAAYDNDGVATHDKTLVGDGVLQSYVLGSYAARKLGMQTTANAGGVHNLQVKPTGVDFKALLAEMKEGLLVTDLMGQGINIVTGDYSRGAAGFWVENGEIQYPVEEITIAGNLRDMFAQVLHVADDVDMRGNIHSGSLLIESMTLAGD